MQRRYQWSAPKTGVTSALRLHNATNAYLSMKHDVARQAANEMALKEVDKFFFDQRISLTVVTTVNTSHDCQHNTSTCAPLVQRRK